MFAFYFLTACTTLKGVFGVSPSYNGLGLTPQMGWDSWNTFACDVSEQLLLDTADRISDLGLKDMGYNTPVLGTLGLWGVRKKMLNSFANNRVDYLKYDNCYNKGQFGTPDVSYHRYKAMSDALNKTGRPIFYSLCNWGQDLTFYWGSGIANSWRMSGDITAEFTRPDSRCPCDGDEYDCKYAGFHCSIMNILNKAAPMGQNAGVGGWNDLDNLEVGVVKPLSSQLIKIQKGIPATRVWRYYVSDTDEYGQGEIQMWSGPLDNGDQVVALLNGGSVARPMNTTLEEIFFDSNLGSKELTSTWDIYDLWANRVDNSTASAILEQNKAATGILYNATEQSYKDGLSKNDTRLFGQKIGSLSPNAILNTTVPAHGIAFYRLRPSA
ncbi:AHL_G0031480.mRNA.1.CDS.1 [Saccharomyces cerevisiae]|nr:AHL_G0031480.mRNA.1.CDS.1 [Saccharomyces cerevisiae]CAI6757723.1 AHL_G0031480.mRNA.1.CDS.1 [Saccharomyces cerevisiae]